MSLPYPYPDGRNHTSRPLPLRPWAATLDLRRMADGGAGNLLRELPRKVDTAGSDHP
jgi:hypothetical protein